MRLRWCERRAAGCVPPPSVDESDARQIVALALDQASRRLQAQPQDADAKDLEIMGLLGADAAVIALLIAADDSLGYRWWIPGVLLFVASILHLRAVFPRQVDSPSSTRRRKTAG
jgi:hypothetical protein